MNYLRNVPTNDSAILQTAVFSSNVIFFLKLVSNHIFSLFSLREVPDMGVIDGPFFGFSKLPGASLTYV